MVASKAIDEIDIKIVLRLLKNSRTRFSEIAEECNVTTLTIKNRYNLLTKAGIITGSTVIRNLAKSGFKFYVALEIEVNYQQVDRVIKDIREITGIQCRKTKLTKNFNVIFWSSMREIGEIEKLKDVVKQRSGVIDVKTNIWTYRRISPNNLSLQPVKLQVP